MGLCTRSWLLLGEFTGAPSCSADAEGLRGISQRDYLAERGQMIIVRIVGDDDVRVSTQRCNRNIRLGKKI